MRPISIMKESSFKYIPTVLFTCIIVYAWIVLAVMNGDLLFTIQNFSPWLGTHDYFVQNVSHPGGLREWIGDWLTQLFYYPWLGAGVLVLFWVISASLLIKSCRLTDGFKLLSLIPVIALLTSITQLGYWVFCLKTPSYWFGSTVGLFFVSLVSFLYSRSGKVVRWIVLALWILFGFPALGWIATIGILFLLLLTPFRSSWKEWTVNILSVIVPMMAVLSYYSHSESVHWRDSLLLYGFPHVAIPEASSQLLEVAPIVMVISLLLLPVLGRMRTGEKADQIALLVSTLLLAVSLYCSNMLNYRNANFHAELSMMRAMEDGRWDDLLQTMRQSDRKPTREMVMMKDVALAQKGRLAEEAFKYDVRGVRPAMVVNLPIHMAHSAAPLMYYWLGLPNYAYMWSMENSIEYGLSPYWLKLFYRSAVVNGEEELARKYKKLLHTTLFYNDYEVSEEELNAVRRYVNKENKLDNDGGFSEGFIMTYLCKLQYDDAEAQEIALHYAMLMRQPETFAIGLDHYTELVGADKPLPVHYQEALLLFAANQTNNDEEILSSLPIAKEVRASFEQYRATVAMTLQQPLPPEVMGDRVYARFGHTYWWYYDFYTNNKTY